MSLLYLIRHGETPLNVARVLQPADTPLSATGQRQAQALAQRLKDVGLAGILSSDLPRALQTAQALAQATGLPLRTTPRLHERNFGALRGLAYDHLDHDPLTRPEAPPGGESLADFQARCAEAWAELCALQAQLQGPLAVVTHGLVLRCWLSQGPLQLAAGQAAPERLGNTGLTVATAAAPHRVQVVNCTRHLEHGAGTAGDALGDKRDSLSGG